jgi:hypothetical protein
MKVGEQHIKGIQKGSQQGGARIWNGGSGGIKETSKSETSRVTLLAGDT